jgi:HAD superfamily hydrolase (TIGR01549 family)
MDDTIFDHSLTCRAALAELRRQWPFLRGTPLNDQWRSYGSLLGTTHRRVMLGLRRSDDARRERFLLLAARAGKKITDDEAEELSQTYRRHYQRLRRSVPGAPEAVRALHRRARIGIVTNNTVAEQREKIGFLGLDASIDDLVTSEEVGAAKPDRRIFRAALERGGAEPSEAIMVGDSWSADVVGARDAGIRAVWFNRFRIPRPEPSDVPEFASFERPRRLDALLAVRATPRDAAWSRRRRPHYIARPVSRARVPRP